MMRIEEFRVLFVIVGFLWASNIYASTDGVQEAKRKCALYSMLTFAGVTAVAAGLAYVTIPPEKIDWYLENRKLDWMVALPATVFSCGAIIYTLTKKRPFDTDRAENANSCPWCNGTQVPTTI